MSEELKVRLGGPQDEEPMLELLMEAWEENGIQNVNREKVRATIKPALYLWHGLCGVVGEIGKPIEAAILLNTVQMWYSDDWIVEEKLIYVRPEFRKVGAKHRSTRNRGHAHALCDFSKRVANEMELPLVIGVLSNQRTVAKVRLYERQFGSPAGAFFLFNAKTGHDVVEH